MSLLGKKKLNFDELHKGKEESNKQKRGGGNTEGLSKRPKPKRKFQIAENELIINHPFFKNTDTGTSKNSNFLSTLDPHSLFSTLTTSSTTKESNSSVKTRHSKAVETALASSKLSDITSDGPVGIAPKLGKRQLKAAKKHVKSLTKGPGWYNMAKTEVTKEKKNDLDVLKLRSAMDGMHHYKRNHMTHTPKYFQTGTIVETKADFYSARIPKRQRKATLAQEFAAEFGM